MHQLLGFFFKYPAYISQQTSSNPAALKSRRRERKKTWGSRRSRRRRFPARFTMFLLTLRIAVRNFAWAHQLCASSINSLRAHRIELGVQTLQSSPYIGGVQSCQTVIDGVFGTTVKKIVCLWPQVCIGIVVYTVLYYIVGTRSTTLRSPTVKPTLMDWKLGHASTLQHGLCPQCQHFPWITSGAWHWLLQ